MRPVLVLLPSPPDLSSLAYDDGRTQLLLCVHGLLPISFRNASYNIPIAVWLTRDYPRQPPIAYVVPTADMLVKAGKHIDVSGKCEIEFMQNWARKSEVGGVALLSVCVIDRLPSRRAAISRRCWKPCSTNSRKNRRSMQSLQIHSSSSKDLLRHSNTPRTDLRLRYPLIALLFHRNPLSL